MEFIEMKDSVIPAPCPFKMSFTTYLSVSLIMLKISDNTYFIIIPHYPCVEKMKELFSFFNRKVIKKILC